MFAEQQVSDRQERLDRVADLVRQRVDAREVQDVVAFVAAIYARMPREDVLDYTAESLYGAALAMYRFAAQHACGTSRVRVYNPRAEEHGWKATHTIVELVNDDMPFLVDSVTGALNRRGHAVHLVVHPVLPVKRDGEGRWQGLGRRGDADARLESLIHVEIGEIGDPDRREALAVDLRSVMADVRAAYEDWQPMLDRLDGTLADLERDGLPAPEDDRAETIAFLRWMRDNHFTFLGVRDLEVARRPDGSRALDTVADSGLGILRDPARKVIEPQGTAQKLAPILGEFLSRPELLLVTKTSVRGTVHRAVHMDYVGVKRFDGDGNLVGERRFIGLLTATAYNRSPRDIPLLRRRVSQVIERSGFDPGSHDGKSLLNILESYPRDELFNSDVDTLFDIALGIHALQERPRLRLFVRRDRFERYYSCLIFLPRERLSTHLRTRIERILVDAFNGRLSNHYTQVSDSALARLHVIIGTDPGAAPAHIDRAAIEAKLVEAARDWHDDLNAALLERWGEERGNLLARRYASAFQTSYTETFNADLALSDIERIESIDGPDAVVLNFYRAIEDGEHLVRFKLYHPGEAISLSDTLPMLENMGFWVLGENAFPVHLADGPPVWIHDYHMQARHGGDIDLPRLKQRMEDTFAAVWHDRIENDGFNALVLRAGLAPREAVVIRAYAKYLKQVGSTFSQAYMEDTAGRHPEIVRGLVALFHARFDPARGAGRADAEAAAATAIEQALESVASLDEDRILRRFLNLVQATVRTNFHVPAADGGDREVLAFKLDSGQVAEMPLPRPWREIFVYGPRFEAIHLRGGPVARGGLRWSDRREDFRTEVLGLMKAQQVKNAVIVPVGSKGGFVPKRLPSGDREAIQAEGIACYRAFITAMLDVTDNLAAGEVVPPRHVVRHDGDDPYLVVAADKGTATFSDIANEIAVGCGFWLGDAFASGGAAGYDHKKMAITSRGAWEAVKRHFRELGRDIQSAPFTCVGIGDMSGDVFGNGMLRSRSTLLLAAFDHRDVFVDPAPDPELSFAERERLFALPRSSWQDYDRAKISAGGGVFSRQAKSIPLSPEIRALTGLAADRVPPNDLIRALLTADVDLLWNGGIGTFVKAHEESHADAGDRNNDGIRVDAERLRCLVVGEGGNLGLTQRARIAAARHGIRLNTDAIDNSAGVDCSDHEVNIKILLGQVVADGEMTGKQRDRLLAEMTDEVADLVLRDNYLQTQALTLHQDSAAAALEEDAWFMRLLERQGKLDRAVEVLPDDEEVAKRLAARGGLTRPESAVLLAYAKMDLFGAFLAGDLADSEYLSADLVKYFPRPLRKQFRDDIVNHRLRKEIIATVTANSVVNRMGITFVHRLTAESGDEPSHVARAYALMRDAFGMRRVWGAIEALDARVDSQVQTEMLLATQQALARATIWALRNFSQPIRVKPTLALYQPGIAALAEGLDGLLGPMQHAAYERRALHLAAAGVPDELARQVARLEPLAAGPDIVAVALQLDRPVEVVAAVHFGLGARLGIDWLLNAADEMAPGDRWTRLAVTAVVEELTAQLRQLTAEVLRQAGSAMPGEALDAWVAGQPASVARFVGAIDDIRQAGTTPDLARLALANRALRRLVVRPG